MLLCAPQRHATLCANCSCSAVLGLTNAALSQVSLVTGFGNSCSQPLLAKRPSYTQGSGRKMNSMSSAGVIFAAARLEALNFRAGLTGRSAEPATRPMVHGFRHALSE